MVSLLFLFSLMQILSHVGLLLMTFYFLICGHSQGMFIKVKVLALQIQQLVPIKLEAWGSNQEVIAYILLMNPLGKFNLTYHQST